MEYYYVYIMASASNVALYIGVTNNLKRRVLEHKSGSIEGFSQHYKTHKLVYFEKTMDINTAILREKQLKKWSRKKKETLINTMNPKHLDLAAE